MTFWELLAIVYVVAIPALLAVNLSPKLRAWLVAHVHMQEAWTASPNFVYWAAHSCFAAMVLMTAELWYPGHTLETMALGALCAAIKEFGFDETWELPVQTFKNNLDDWLGYCAVGFPIGCALIYAPRAVEWLLSF